jgi:hypothetical protein
MHYFGTGCEAVVLKFLIPWIRVLLEKSIVAQLVKKYVIFNGTQRFINIFVTALYWKVSWASSIQSTSYFHKILLNSTRSLKWSHSFRISDQMLDVCLTTPMHATYPTHFILFNLTNLNKHATECVHTDL